MQCSPHSVPSQCPPQFSAAWTIADALSQRWLKVLWSHTDSPSCGPILEEQGLPVPHHLLCQLGQEGAVLLLSLCPGVIISAFWTESKTQLRQSQLQLRFRWGLFPLLFPSLCFQGQFLSTAQTTEQKPHNNPPFFLCLLLVNYFISSLCILTGVLIFHGNCIHEISPLRNPRRGVPGGSEQPNPPSYK